MLSLLMLNGVMLNVVALYEELRMRQTDRQLEGPMG
jgi:hypothetical protein